MRRSTAMLNRRRWATAVCGIWTGGVITLVVSCGASGPSEPLYKTELRKLEDDLTARRAVGCIQEWLDERQAGPESVARDRWPACVRQLAPVDVRDTGRPGVAMTLPRTEGFVAIVLPTLTVYPPGQRPLLDAHVPSTERPGYLGPFGPDACIRFSER